MTTLDLYKFIKNYDIEYHWFYESNGVKNVIMFINYDHIKYFNSLLDSSFFDDGGMDCKLFDGYIGIEMKEICDYYGIELNDIFNQ